MLVAYRNSSVAPEVAEALRRLELAAVARKAELRIVYSGVPPRLSSWSGVQEDPGPTGLPPHISMRPSGREVYLSIIEGTGGRNLQRELNLLWGLAVPLGFIPWSRYPVPGPYQEVFHYLGSLAPIVDFLHSQGRGDLSWPSLCCASQILAGTWEGGELLERKIQTHLHRVGVHSGPVDGEITEATLISLRSLGFGGSPLSELLPKLESLPPPQATKRQKGEGFFSISGNVEGFSSGGVNLIRTGSGFTVAVSAPGRAIFEFGG